MPNDNTHARLLIVEDDPAIQHLLAYLLQPGYTLHLAGDFDDALQAAARHPFDLFLLDINLKEPRSGIDLLNHLRETPAGQATPAVACTACVLPNQKELFLASGFDGYLAKPFTSRELVSIIEQHLKARPCAAAENLQPLPPQTPAPALPRAAVHC